MIFCLFLEILGSYVKVPVLAGIVVFFLLLVIAALSRHKKAGARALELVGEIGTAHGDLTPAGFVIVQGELLPAISATGEAHENGKRLLVVGVKSGRLAVNSTVS